MSPTVCWNAKGEDSQSVPGQQVRNNVTEQLTSQKRPRNEDLFNPCIAEPSGKCGFVESLNIFANFVHSSPRKRTALISAINKQSIESLGGAGNLFASEIDVIQPPGNSSTKPICGPKMRDVPAVDIEEAPTGRAKCRSCGNVIEKGSLRTVVMTRLRQGASRMIKAYQHVTCTDGVQINLEQLSTGWASLTQAQRESVRLSI